MNIRVLLACCACGYGSLAAAQQPGTYTIDPHASEVFWRAYSSGALANLGHNHVISAPTLSGRVTVRPQLADSEVEIEVAIVDLLVDDPGLRTSLGDDFASQPSDRDIAGTRRNMLSSRLLDADNHPTLRIHGTALKDEGDAQSLTLTLELAGNTVEITAPVRLNFTANALTASGEFQLTHDALGLRPFSAALGALKVAEEIDFSYRIEAALQ